MKHASRTARHCRRTLVAGLRRSHGWLGGGFTLIELLIVVVIISVIAAVAIPSMLSRLASTQDEMADMPDEPIRQAPPSAVAGERPGGGRGLPPVIESSTIELDLRASHVLDGFRVFTRYVADYSATFVVRNADPVVDTITLSFPFPPDINEARGVSLQFLDAQGNLSDPPQVSYGLEGIEWTGSVEPGATVTAVVTYTAQGRDAFVYDVVGRGRSGTVQVDLRLRNAPRAVVPPGALQPAERDGSLLSWRFDALITNKSIVVELPAGTSPLGRVILVLQLAGLAVLVFGGGFWYLSEGQAPGRLDDFRWGHFLLLALNYSMFFGIFAVLGYQGSPTVALTTAAVVSLPLLTLHGVRITDAWFTVTRIMPLAVLTLATVFSGVFLDQQRPIVFLTVTVVAIAFLTVTYEPWAAIRKSHSEEKAGRREREAREDELTESLDVLRILIREQEQTHLVSRHDLDDAPAGFEAERAAVERLLDLHEKALAKAKAAVKPDGGWETLPHEARLHRLADLQAAATRCSNLLEGRGNSLKGVVKVLETAVQEASDRLRRERSAIAELLGDASAVEHEARTTMDEGGERPERAQLEQILNRLSEARHERERSSGGGEPEEGDLRSAVSAAEHHSRTLTGLVALVRDATERLRAAIDRARERERLATEGSEAVHCLACGEALPSDHRFCAHCGTLRPLDISCPACGLTTRLPQHILSEEWGSPAIHCSSCGKSLPSEEADGELDSERQGLEGD